MIIKKVENDNSGEIKLFISNILLEIFKMPARGLEDLEDIKNNFLVFYAAYIDGKLIGTCGLKIEDGKGRVSRMYVEKEMRGKGLGKKLLNKVKDFARNNGILELFLTTYIQMGSVNFYESQGFSVYKTENDKLWMKNKL